MWAKSTEIYTNPDNSRVPIVVFMNTYTGYGLDQFPNGGWGTVDLKPHGITADANWAFLAGLILISGAAVVEMMMRAPGSVIGIENYLCQGVSARNDTGERSGCAFFVPLVNGCFELAIRHRAYPSGNPLVQGLEPAAGVNLSLQAWGR